LATDDSDSRRARNSLRSSLYGLCYGGDNDNDDQDHGDNDAMFFGQDGL
jgi:hypothetical protein